MFVVSPSRTWQRAARIAAVLLLVGPTLAACGFAASSGTGARVSRAAFTSDEYGVSSSPRVTRDVNPRRGGGRYQVGNPYVVRGRTYTPREDPNYAARGTASWYGSDFHGRRTANGEIFSANAITGAHPTLPLPSYVRVTNLDNGRSLVVRINDRGPFLHGRIIDLSHRAAEMLGYVNNGMANVEVNYVGRAPLEGDDTRRLIATFEAPNGVSERTRIATGSDDTTSVADIAGSVFQNLFSYADGGVMTEPDNAAGHSAHDAVNAMAARSTDLEVSAEAVHEAREVRLQIGAFADPDHAADIATQFALLGAVDEEPVRIGGQDATLLTVTYLKPGVARADVLALARSLGLGDVVLQ